MPVRIAIMNDYEIVVAGVAAVLAPFEPRIEVVELDVRRPVLSDIDVLLYDTFGQPQGKNLDLDDMVKDGSAKIAIFTWNTQRELIDHALARGASGYLSKALTGEEIVRALEAIHNGEIVVETKVPEDRPRQTGDWPGRSYGLTQRESEVLALITQGLTNQEIADRAYISINSVKTYIRTAYRKINVSRRSQAVSWGIQHGFQPDRVRVIREP